MTDDDTTTRALTAASALLFVGGLLVSLVLLASVAEVLLTLLAAGVLPMVLGYVGLSRYGALPWRSGGSDATDVSDEDLVEELKRKYAAGELDEAEMERKVEAILSAERGGSGSTRSTGRSRERAYERR